MKKHNQLTKRYPILEITMICVLILIIIGTVILLLPTAYRKQYSSENQSSALLSAEDCNVSASSEFQNPTNSFFGDNPEKPTESKIPVGDTYNTETSTEENTAFAEITTESSKTNIDLEACLFGLTEDEKAKVYEIMDGMTLRERIYQMMIVPPVTDYRC